MLPGNIEEKHIFSVYLDNLSEIISNIGIDQSISILNKDLYLRLIKILRLNAGEKVIFFDKNIKIESEILKSTFESKNKLYLKILKKDKIERFLPEIIYCQGLLKKPAFESVLYTACVMAVSKIIPVLSSKVQKNWMAQIDRQRFDNIMVSACEQSKNYVLPELDLPLSFENFLNFVSNSQDFYKKILFDPEGQNLFNLMADLNKYYSKPEKQGKKVLVLMGTEGGFSQKELELLKNHNFEFYALTPTILRSVDAASVALGALRSVI